MIDESQMYPDRVTNQEQAMYMAHAEDANQTQAVTYDKEAQRLEVEAARKLVEAAEIVPRHPDRHSSRRDADLDKAAAQRLATGYKEDAAKAGEWADQKRQEAGTASAKIAKHYEALNGPSA
jgi:hypothetical protein